MNKLTKLINLIQPEIENLGYKFVSLKIGREQGRKALIIVIDKEDSKISVEDCAIVSRKIERMIEEQDPMKESYLLIVSSKGIDS